MRNSRFGLQGKPILSTDLFHRTAELFYDVYVGWPRSFFGGCFCAYGLNTDLVFYRFFVSRLGWGWEVVHSFFHSICVFFLVRGGGGLILPTVDVMCGVADNRYSVCTF